MKAALIATLAIAIAAPLPALAQSQPTAEQKAQWAGEGEDRRNKDCGGRMYDASSAQVPITGGCYYGRIDEHF